MDKKISMADTHTTSPASSDNRALEEALAGLQGTASQFGATCINDARARLQYARDIAAVPGELRAAIDAGRVSVGDAAAQAVALRNRIMELARRRSSPTARAYAMRLKREGRSVSELSEKYAQRLSGDTFSALSERRQASVFKEIIQASSRPDEGVMRLAKQLGRAGRRLLLVSLAVAVYDVAEADDKPREVIRQGALAGAGVIGGWTVGSAAVADQDLRACPEHLERVDVRWWLALDLWGRCRFGHVVPTPDQVIIVTEPLNLERRAPVWEALSELFVGKELQDYDYAGIAKTLRLSGYSLEELEKVLREEVAPVFRSNLSALAVPEMEGWGRDTVVKMVRAYLERERTGLSRLLARLGTFGTLPGVAAKRWVRLRSVLREVQ